MSAAARPRWRVPPNTISALETSPRATAVNPSIPSSPIPTMDSQRVAAAVSPATTSRRDMRRILILGGTTEARLLAERLAARPDLAVTLSLAGRTASPIAQPVPVRSGGFGGPQGLAEYLTAEHIDALVDATHPYAATMSTNAVHAAHSTGVSLLALR